MASPQPNNFTRLSNELLENFIKISRHLSPYEITIWLCVVRKTYGYGKKNDWVSLGQIQEMTGILQPHVARTKKKLLIKNLILQNEARIGIQKDYEKWNIPKQVYNVYPNRYKGIPKQALPKQVVGTTQTGNQLLPKQVDTKDNITKDNITKERGGGRFAPPTLSEIKSFWGENGLKGSPVVSNQTLVSKQILGSVQTDNQVVSKRLPTKDILTKDTNTKDIYSSFSFESLWERYPSKLGRKKAEPSFRRSVKTEQDWNDINKALDNYLASSRVKEGFIQNGSTWFNNWRDWIDYKEVKLIEYLKVPKEVWNE